MEKFVLLYLHFVCFVNKFLSLDSGVEQRWSDA